jgi:hypothetical protein
MAVIARTKILDALAGEIIADLEIGDQRCSGRFADLDLRSDVILVAVREHDMGRAGIGGTVVAGIGRVGDERIDHDHRTGNLDAECRMAEPGKFHPSPPARRFDRTLWLLGRI